MIEKFVFQNQSVFLRNSASTTHLDESQVGADKTEPSLEENIFSIDSISLLIGDNGSGKTRLLDEFWDSLDRWERSGWRSEWRPVMHKNSLARADEFGVILFSHAPNKREKKSSFTNKCVDASPIGRKRYPPESLFGKEEILRGVTNIDPHFVGEFYANVGMVINRCVELLLSETISAPERWANLSDIIATFVKEHPSSLFSTKLDSNTGEWDVPQMFGIEPDLDVKLTQLSKEVYNEAVRHGRSMRAIAVFSALFCEIKKSDDPDEILRFGLVKYFRFVNKEKVSKPDRSITKRIDSRVKALESVMLGGYGTERTISGPNQFRFRIRLYSNDDVRRLRESPLGDVVTLGWSNVSSGQWALVVQLIEIEKAFIELAKKDNISSILLLIDEGDAFLHLEWQRQYISILDRMLLGMKKRYEGKIHYVQAIIATHSPLLASDVPSGYVNRLKEGQVVDHSFSFAAPYHSLLNTSFGARSIGAHATNVIRDAVTNIKSGIVTDRDRYVVSIVDDPIIKRELNDLLNRY